MTQHIQRYPFAPKAVWWKRYTDKAALGKRIIYAAKDNIGFEIVNLRNFSKVSLTTKDAEIADIKHITEKIADDQYKTVKAIKLFNKFYIFNVETNSLEEHDLADEGMEIINAEPSETMMIEKNSYLKKYAFDCIKETDQQDSSYQPISGLTTSSSYLTIKTHNFTNAKDEPKHEDIVFYQGRFWVIEDTSKTYIYTPRERSVLHLSLKAINK